MYKIKGQPTKKEEVKLATEDYLPRKIPRHLQKKKRFLELRSEVNKVAGYAVNV